MSELKQNTPEWLEKRKQCIGASDAPILMNVSPWRTPFQLWEEKLGLRQFPVSDAMKRGLEKEEEARQRFEKMTGLLMMPEVVFHKEYKWMMASLDGIDTNREYIVEIKCPGKIDHEAALNGSVPDKYLPQLQHQLLCSDLKMAFYFSYDGANGVIVEVKRDDDYIEKMINEEKKFYNCMVSFDPPDLTERDYNLMQDEKWKETAQEYMKIKKDLSLMEQKEKQLKQTLIDMSGRSNAMGAGIKLSKVMRKGTVNYASIPLLKNIDLDLYRNPYIESWRVVPA